MQLDQVIGAFVFTSDGRELGRVKKCEAAAFLVDAPLAFDYWLASALVVSADADRVTLRISASDLAAQKMDGPFDLNEFQSSAPESLTPAAVRDRFIAF